MLRWRLAGAAAIITPLLVLVWLDDGYNGGKPGIWLLPLISVFGLAACDELAQLFRAGKHDIRRGPVAIGAILAMSAAWTPFWYGRPVTDPVGDWGWCLLGIVAAMWWLVCCELRAFREPGHSVARLAISLFAIVYVVVPLAFLLQLRVIVPGRAGLVALISVVFIVKCADTGAYFVGKSLGRHKLAPILSPKKTWEGVIGAIVAAELAVWVYLHGIAKWALGAEATFGGSAAIVLLYGLTLAVAGMLGDLGESLIKRDVCQKDSASWLPGLGGTLDILDSMMLAGPVAYIWWASGVLGPFARVVS